MNALRELLDDPTIPDRSDEDKIKACMETGETGDDDDENNGSDTNTNSTAAKLFVFDEHANELNRLKVDLNAIVLSRQITGNGEDLVALLTGNGEIEVFKLGSQNEPDSANDMETSEGFTAAKVCFASSSILLERHSVYDRNYILKR